MNSFKEETNARQALYSFIARLMLVEADEKFLVSFESEANLLSMFPNYKEWNKKKEFSKADLIAQYLNVDFTNLFLMHLIPYESFYTRDDQMIESGGNNPIIELYNSYDFRVELDKARVVSPDHIGVELEFMYMLCSALQKAQEADDAEGIDDILRVQKDFLEQHLLRWAPMFLINVKRESITPLYHDGAEFALDFLLSDFEYINSKLKKSC
jgi:putative dimethyl sulfoxide reductase chaperone